MESHRDHKVSVALFVFNTRRTEVIDLAKGKYAEWLEEDNLIRLQGWARDGLTDEQIAHNIGINVKTLYDWKNKHSKICNALKSSKELADREVENALFRSAMGYSTEEEVWERVVDKDTGEANMVLTKRMIKHIPASQTAQIFWLKNRKPEEWREKRITEEHIEFESDGFLEALKGEVPKTFEEAGDTVET